MMGKIVRFVVVFVVGVLVGFGWVVLGDELEG